MNTSSDNYQCALPEVVNHIVEVSASVYSMDLPRTLMKGYLNCHGFARSLLNADWPNQIYEFSFLITIFWISVLIAALGLIWFVYEFLHEKLYRAENTTERYLRFGLSITLLVLLLPYSFCLWLAFVSYYSIESVHADNKVILSENRQLSSFFEKYKRSMKLSPLTEGGEKIKHMIDHFSKNIASQLEGFTPKVIQKADRSIIAKISLKSTDIIQFIQKMQDELQNLMADVIQLSDYTRLIYRNTTTILDLEHINYNVYSEFLHKEFKANEQKIIMLLNIENTLIKIQQVAEFASTMDNLRQDLINEMYGEFNMLRQHLRETITKNAFEYKTLNDNFSALLERMQHQTAPKGDFYLRPYIRHLEVTFCAVALLTLVLVCVVLERLVRRSKNRTFTRYVLMSIIALISTSIILLCVFVIAQFLHVVIYYNYRKEIDENEDFCNIENLPYCSLHSQARLMLHGNLYKNITTAVKSYRKNTLQRLCRNILEYNVNPHHILWTQELSDQSTFFEEIFRSGAMFDVVNQELNLENWYELHNMLSTQGVQDKISNTDMLICNLNIIKKYIFEQLYKRGILVSLIKLTQQSTILKSHLPASNLTRLIKRVLREAQDLQDFCVVLENLLQEQLESVIELFASEFFAFDPTFKELPLCGDFKFASLGISRETYKCIEYSLHGFHIGAFGILIILFAILLICICLVMLYEKKGAIGVIRTSSLSRIRSGDGSAASSDRVEKSAAMTSLKDTRNSPVKRPTRVRFQEIPTVSGGKRHKWRYFAPEELKNVTRIPKREQVQVKKRLAEPSQLMIRNRRRRRRVGRYKYLNAKLRGAKRKRKVAVMTLGST